MRTRVFRFECSGEPFSLAARVTVDDAQESRFCEVLRDAFEQADSDIESMVVMEVQIEPAVEGGTATSWFWLVWSRLMFSKSNEITGR